MKSLQKGFTLIELMIVIAIIGILAAIAIPAYQDYTVRAQVTEGLSLAAGLETAISEYYASHGTWPAATVTTAPPTGLGLQGTVVGKYGTMDVYANGVIQMKFSATAPSAASKALDNAILGISAGLDGNGDLVWVCGNATPPTLTGGQSAPPNANGTTITKSNYLPASCK